MCVHDFCEAARRKLGITGIQDDIRLLSSACKISYKYN